MVVATDGEPADTTLGSERGLMLRPVEQAIDDFLRETGERRDPHTIDIAAE
jgi:hypothetical protein